MDHVKNISNYLKICFSLVAFIPQCFKTHAFFCDGRLPPWLPWILPSSGLLCDLRWFETDVSGLPIGFFFKGQEVQEASWTAGIFLHIDSKIDKLRQSNVILISVEFFDKANISPPYHKLGRNDFLPLWNKTENFYTLLFENHYFVLHRIRIWSPLKG
jgi:hypothetical protein